MQRQTQELFVSSLREENESVLVRRKIVASHEAEPFELLLLLYRSPNSYRGHG